MADISVRALGPDVLTRARDAQAQGTHSRDQSLATYTVVSSSGDTFSIVLRGRLQWALDRLRDAGEQGCTPITEPTGPRWSSYIHDLRGLGVEIETHHEAHGGDYPGTHARYVLRSTVRKGGDT